MFLPYDDSDVQNGFLIYKSEENLSANSDFERVSCCIHPHSPRFDRFRYSTLPCVCFALQENREERCCTVARRMVAVCLSNVSATLWARTWGCWIDRCWQSWRLVSREKCLSDTYRSNIWSAFIYIASYHFYQTNMLKVPESASSFCNTFCLASRPCPDSSSYLGFWEPLHAVDGFI